MVGGAWNYHGTRGHGCSHFNGERPNFNIHTLNDITRSFVDEAELKDLKGILFGQEYSKQ
jgi:hypothetical protein